MSQNQVSLFSYDPEEENLRRKESVIQAMQQKMQRGLQPVSVGGQVAAPSMGSLLAGLAENYISMKGGEKLGKEREALADRRAQELREGFEQFDRTSRGGWVEPGNGQAGPPQAVTGDRRKAIFDALAKGAATPRERAEALCLRGELLEDRLDDPEGALEAYENAVGADPEYRPAWLDLAHKRLDEAVFAAYGWPSDLTDEQILERLLALNLERAAVR